MTEHTLRTREYKVDVTGAPDTEGLTTGLNRATVSPESVEVWQSYSGDGSTRARIRGRHIRANGQPSDLRVTVSVSLDDNVRGSHTPAPQWVHDLHAEVVASR